MADVTRDNTNKEWNVTVSPHEDISLATAGTYVDGDINIKGGGLPYAAGTGTAAKTTSPYNFAKWEADISEITELKDGLVITYKVPVAGNGTYGTCLQINSLGYHPVVRAVNSMISTRYAVNSTILLVYNSSIDGTVYNNSATSSTIKGCWICINDTDNDTNTLGYLIRDQYLKPYAAEAIYRYKLCALDQDNRIIPLVTTNQSNTTLVAKQTTQKSFRASTGIFYYNSTTTISAGNAVGNQTLYSQYSNADPRYTFNGTVGTTTCLSAYKMVYIKGSYNKSTDMFTLVNSTTNNWFVQVPMNTASINYSSYFEANKYYILVGYTYSSADNFSLTLNNNLYLFNGESLIPVENENKINLSKNKTGDTQYPILISDTDISSVSETGTAISAQTGTEYTSIQASPSGNLRVPGTLDTEKIFFFNNSFNIHDETVFLEANMDVTSEEKEGLRCGTNFYVSSSEKRIPGDGNPGIFLTPEGNMAITSSTSALMMFSTGGEATEQARITVNSNGQFVFRAGPSGRIATQLDSDDSYCYLKPTTHAKGYLGTYANRWKSFIGEDISLGHTDSTVTHDCNFTNNVSHGSIRLNTTGAFGLYDYTNSAWLFYKNMKENGQLVLQGSTRAASGFYVSADAKTTYNDGKAGLTMSTTGNLTLCSTSDPTISFYTSSATTIKSQIKATGSYLRFYAGSTSYPSVDMAADSNYGYWRPTTTNKAYLGTSTLLWKAVYSSTSTIQTSDREMKKNIQYISEDVETAKRSRDMVLKAKPCSYMFKSTNSDRVHYGLIAQDVEEIMNEDGITSMEFAGLCKDWNEEEQRYQYGLRYQEFIAPMIHVIQEQQKEIEELKAQINLILTKLDLK